MNILNEYYKKAHYEGNTLASTILWNAMYHLEIADSAEAHPWKLWHASRIPSFHQGWAATKDVERAINFS